MVHSGPDGVDQSKVGAVVARVRRLVAEGVLREGDPLPSTRGMAAELGVARGTVVAAYEQLDGEGWIRTRHGAAARVAATVPQHRPPAVAAGAATAPPPDPSVHVDLRPGIPSVTAISPRDWRAAWRAAADEPLRDELPDPVGTRALREQVAAQLGLSRGFAPSPDQVVITAGTSEALSLVTEALRVRRGRSPVVAVEDPGYDSGRQAVTSAGGTLVAVAVDDQGLDPEAVPAGTDVVSVTPTHQYPMGSVMPLARRLRLLEVAHELGAAVVEDDYDSEFRHRGDPVPALAALDARGVVLHVGSFSKVLDPRLRCGYVVLPATDPHGYAAAVRAAREARGAVVGEPVQAALTHLLRTGALRRHLGRVRRDYAHKRALIDARLATLPATAGVTAHALDGGLHAVLTWEGSPTSAEVVDRLRRRGFLLADLADYSMDPATARPGVVLGYGAATSLDLSRALDALADALRSR